MRLSGWILFALATAYCADTLLYYGVHAQAAITLARHVAQGILLGLMRYV